MIFLIKGVDYKCSCTGYWTGKNCIHLFNQKILLVLFKKWLNNLFKQGETEIPLCERPNPCNNEGLCENNKCVCNKNFTGPTCETFSPPDQIGILKNNDLI